MGILSDEEFWEKWDKVITQRKGNVMTMPTATVKAFNEGVTNMQNFKQGYVKGIWFDPKELLAVSVGQLPANLRTILNTQNENADLFVVFSFDTPIAWYSLKDSDSKGTNKWYFPTVRFGEKYDQHQHQMRYLLNLFFPNKTAKLLPNGKQMKA